MDILMGVIGFTLLALGTITAIFFKKSWFYRWGFIFFLVGSVALAVAVDNHYMKFVNLCLAFAAYHGFITKG